MALRVRWLSKLEAARVVSQGRLRCEDGGSRPLCRFDSGLLTNLPITRGYHHGGKSPAVIIFVIRRAAYPLIC